MNAILASDEAKQSSTDEWEAPVAKPEYSAQFLFALCRVYATVLARWGGGGRDDITKPARWEDPVSERESQSRKEKATSTADPFTFMLLNVLCFSTPIVQTSWALSQSHPGVVSDIYSVIDNNRR